MLYKFLQIPAKIALLIWCRYLKKTNDQYSNLHGPLLIAANHPNSFLDAILLCSIFKQPIYSLARGDAFKNNFAAKILRSLKMFPVYRVSEGVENLEENYNTFEECIKIFKKNGIVLIFSEGKCVNEWHLRPLKKGTARLAVSAWEQGIALKVIPLGINYQSFTSFGKNIHLHFGDVITQLTLPFKKEESSGTKIQLFNAELKNQLEQLVIETKPKDEIFIQKIFTVPIATFTKIILCLPALCGYIIHAPLYVPVQKFAFKKFSKIDHYDSVMLGLLFLLYPFYLLLISTILYFWLGLFWAVCSLFLLPFMVYCFVKTKKQF
jgi:1-acyl-sn-glycerol-3-phosphate acyltransferase